MNPNNNTRFKRLRHQILRLRHRTFDTVITDVIMPAKAPIYLKTKNGKDGKRYREALSAEMISHPLGDVRHTAHVGHGSDDVFGDTTFLKNVENAEASTSHQMGSKASSERSLDSMTSSSVRHRNMWKKKSRNHRFGEFPEIFYKTFFFVSFFSFRKTMPSLRSVNDDDVISR